MGVPVEAPFECLGCGDCCRVRGFVRVSAGEVDRIAAFLGLDPRAFAEEYTRFAAHRRGLELEEKPDGACVFLLGDGCAIHPVKPAQCRNFPAGWRYPGVEEVCPAWRQRTTGGGAAMEAVVEKPTPETLQSLEVDGWGIWECGPSTFDWSYDSPETCYILEGRARVATPTGTVEFAAGDLVRFPEGLSCTWTVVEKVRKRYLLG